MDNVSLAIGLTLLAGLSTGIGGAIAFFTKRTNTRFLSVSLGFSAGVMIYVSFVEMFSSAKESLLAELGGTAGSWATIGAFFGGMFLIALIDKLVPSEENPHEAWTAKEMEKAEAIIDSTMSDNGNDDKLLRTGLFTALALAIHNFPEGFATFMSTIKDPALGLSIAVAIAIHNIPEGIAVSVPIYYATGDRKKAFFYSLFSGLAEPLGALVGYLILAPFLSETLFGIVFAAVAGIMVFISFDQLLPAAREYGEHHLSILGLVAGMVLMAVSLILLK